LAGSTCRCSGYFY